MRDLARAWRLSVAAHVSDDERTLAKTHLRSVVVADPHSLHKAERRAQPCHRLAHVGIDEHRDDRCSRDGPIRFHVSREWYRSIPESLARGAGGSHVGALISYCGATFMLSPLEA